MEFRVLNEVAEVIPGTSPKGEFINSDGLGYPFFQGVKEFGTVYPTPERYTEKPIRLAQSGDILFSVRAPVGRTNIATSDCAIGRGVMAIRPNSSQDRNHLLYFLRSIEDKWDSLGSTGSVFESINVSNLRELNVTWPKNRLEASETLWKLDEKIRVNQKIASTLEQIAQTIFKSWFIDFDPVHAKARGEQPVGMDPETAALFPDSFEDSELGPIPNGWNVSSIAEICDFKPGTPFKSNMFNTDGQGQPIIRIRDLNNHSSKTHTTELNPKGFLAEPGALLVGMDGTFDAVIWRGVPSLVNQRISELKPKDETSAFFVKFSISKELKLLEVNATGTTVGHLSKGEIERLKVLNAGSKLDAAYRSIADSLSEQISTLAAQNRTLASMRDSLLPRLISGELEIPAELLEA